MKNLTLFLWILTTAMAVFFAYHTYTHTGIRYKDLESVMMQNLAVEKGIKIVKRETKKIYLNGIEATEIQGNTPKDRITLNKAKTIKNHTDSLLQIIDSLTFIAENIKIDDKPSLKVENIALLNEYTAKYPQFVSKQDSALQNTKGKIASVFKNENYYFPFIKQNNLHIDYYYQKINYESIDNLVSKIGGTIIRCCFHIPIYVVSKTQKIKQGGIYKSFFFISDCNSRLKPEMQISEGKINVRGDVGEIEIPNVKAQNYDSEGKATKTLTGKIMIMKADGSDTTFTLSTSYTVKKK